MEDKDETSGSELRVDILSIPEKLRSGHFNLFIIQIVMWLGLVITIEVTNSKEINFLGIIDAIGQKMASPSFFSIVTTVIIVELWRRLIMLTPSVKEKMNQIRIQSESRGEARGIARGVAQGEARGEARGLAKAREYFERQQAAKERGEPFHEPPPWEQVSAERLVGRAEGEARTRAYYERLMAAKERGEPFNEPPPWEQENTN